MVGSIANRFSSLSATVTMLPRSRTQLSAGRSGTPGGRLTSGLTASHVFFTHQQPSSWRSSPNQSLDYRGVQGRTEDLGLRREDKEIQRSEETTSELCSGPPSPGNVAEAPKTLM